MMHLEKSVSEDHDGVKYSTQTVRSQSQGA